MNFRIVSNVRSPIAACDADFIAVERFLPR